MGIRVTCPAGHKLHVKSFLAGKRGVCPRCGAKFLVPAEQQVRQPTLASPEIQRVGPGESTTTPTETFSDIGSQSVVIAVADSPVTGTPIAAAPPPLPPPIVETPAPSTPVEPATSPIGTRTPVVDQSIVSMFSESPVTPAARYATQRDRNRRNQFMFAVVLLLAVIVLAAVLVFVLQRGAQSAPIPSTHSASIDFNALGALVCKS
jgi:hypothetical protein